MMKHKSITMKSHHRLIVIFFMTLIMSCDFGKNNSPAHSTEGRTVPENKEITNTNNYKKTGNFESSAENQVGSDKITDTIVENWNLDSPKRKENLYSRFDMTQDQIQRYEKALQAWKESDQEDAYKLLSAGAKIKQEDKILKEILDDSQYQRYQKWSRDNDLRK